ncbi:MAG: hypothetical protein WCO94_08450 [Verrucomicrobiota bacterium]
MRLPLRFIAIFAFVIVRSADAQVQTQLGDVKDSRTTGQFFAGLEVKIKLLGDSVTDAESIRTVINTAVDDTGRDLVDREKQKNEFVKKNGQSQQSWELSVNLKNPARKATVIKELTGEADLLVPKNDPDSIVKIGNFQKYGGQPITAAALSEAGIEIVAYTKEQADAEKAKQAEEAKKNPKANIGEAIAGAFGEMFNIGGGPNSITVQMKDPKEMVADVEFQDECGNKIKGNGWSSSGNRKTKESKTYNFQTKLPDTAFLVIYLATPKSVVTVPFTLKDVFLP